MFGKKIWSLVVAMIAVVAAAQVASATDCSSLVAGKKYAQQFGGFFNFGTLVVPNAGGGYWQFNADGTFTGLATLSIGMPDGTKPTTLVQDLPISGTYQVSWNAVTGVCAGTAHESTMDQNFQLLVNGDGASIEFMHTDFFLAIGFTGLPMQTGKCKNSMLASTYSYNAKGWILPPPAEALPFPFPFPTVSGFAPLVFSGAIKFDGAGNFTGSDTVSLDGLVLPRTFTGTYTVDTNCVATMTMQDDIGNPPIHTEVFILQKAKAIQVINTDLGTVLAFTATKAAE